MTRFNNFFCPGIQTNKFVVCKMLVEKNTTIGFVDNQRGPDIKFDFEYLYVFDIKYQT